MENENKKSRREFLGDVLRKGSLTAMGGLVCIGMTHKTARAEKTSGNILYTGEIAPEMVLYEEITEPVPVGFSDSRCVATDDEGVLYAAGDQAVKVLGPTGRIKRTVNLAVSPFCLALKDMEFFIGTRDSVVISDRQGNIRTSWPVPGDNAWVTGIALNHEYIFIADAGQRTIWCFDMDGKFIRRIGDRNPDRNISGFSVPSPYFKLEMAPDGLLRVANPGRHRIEAYTTNGNLGFTWGSFGNGIDDFTGCCNPASFTVLGDGSIITCEKGVGRVKVYDTFGKLKGFVAEPAQLTNLSLSNVSKKGRVHPFAFDVAADNEGHVYILDRAANAVRIFMKKNQTGVKLG